METKVKLFAVLAVCLLVVGASAAPVINPSVQTRPIVCRYWLTSWLCSETGNSGGGTYQVVMDSSTESTVNIWNFTTDLMNWTSTTTNVYYGQGMNQTPNMTPGDNGLPGDNGEDATIAIGSVTTLLAGESATVENVGSPSAAIFDFGIPTGPQGEQGLPGAANMTAGPPGEQGLQGPTGPANMTAGPAGDAATIDVNHTFMGSPASVTNIGTTAAALLDFVIPSGDSYNASYWTGSNYNASYLTSTFNATYDAKPSVVWNASYENKANITQYAYVTLMAGSAMYPTTNPPSNFNQAETTTNKNNYIYANFTASSSNNTQWIVDMPADWNGGNIVGNFLWTTSAGTGTANWTLSGYRFADNIDLDTALPLIGYSVDTVQTVNYMHVSPDTSAAAVTGTGNMIIFKVGRGADSLTYPAQLMGVRIKYIKTIGAA
jgi:hypothetical protein